AGMEGSYTVAVVENKTITLIMNILHFCSIECLDPSLFINTKAMEHGAIILSCHVREARALSLEAMFGLSRMDDSGSFSGRRFTYVFWFDVYGVYFVFTGTSLLRVLRHKRITYAVIILLLGQFVF
ncbi:hypothetical protein ACJX0J_022320, partial [Zea mays]